MSRAAVQMKNVWHKDLADWLLVNGGKPGWNAAASKHFGVSRAWISTLVHSDAFKDYFGKRRAEMSDSHIFNARERMLGILDRSLDLVEEKLENQGDTLTLGNLVDTIDILAKRTGHGEAKSSEQTIVQNNIQVVTRQELEESRTRMRGARGAPLVLDASAKVLLATPDTTSEQS